MARASVSMNASWSLRYRKLLRLMVVLLGIGHLQSGKFTPSRVRNFDELVIPSTNAPAPADGHETGLLQRIQYIEREFHDLMNRTPRKDSEGSGRLLGHGSS